MWDYAKLSQLAKEHGGPENLINDIIKFGKIEMLPWIGVAAVAGSAATIFGKKAYLFAKEKYQEYKIKMELAKNELVEGVNEYDRQETEEALAETVAIEV
ncbi:MAG: hypothetical protein IJE93_08155 [Clostridia bacterium]|nr:hypothetical protein [Clostridia bacterium]